MLAPLSMQKLSIEKNIDYVNPNKTKNYCAICLRSVGVFLQCNYPGCSYKVHPRCGRCSSVYMKMDFSFADKKEESSKAANSNLSTDKNSIVKHDTKNVSNNIVNSSKNIEKSITIDSNKETVATAEVSKIDDMEICKKEECSNKIEPLQKPLKKLLKIENVIVDKEKVGNCLAIAAKQAKYARQRARSYAKLASRVAGRIFANSQWSQCQVTCFCPEHSKTLLIEKKEIVEDTSETEGHGVVNGLELIHASKVRVLPGGEIYVGDVQQLLVHDDDEVIPHGSGLCIGCDGVMYEGGWKSGKWHGLGTVTDATDRIVYDGEYLDGNRHGTGTYFFENGDRYIGEWKDGVAHGKGSYIDFQGSIYHGDWKNGCRSGRGTYKHYTGGTFEGEWKSDMRDGKGVLRRPDKLYVEGIFRDNLLEGRGKCRYPDGSTYIGMWRNNIKDGRGSLKFPNGAVYEGHFRGDEMAGGGGTGTFTVPRTIIDGDDMIIPIDFQSDLKRMHLKAGFTADGK